MNQERADTSNHNSGFHNFLCPSKGQLPHKAAPAKWANSTATGNRACHTLWLPVPVCSWLSLGPALPCPPPALSTRTSASFSSAHNARCFSAEHRHGHSALKAARALLFPVPPFLTAFRKTHGDLFVPLRKLTPRLRKFLTPHAMVPLRSSASLLHLPRTHTASTWCHECAAKM